MIGARHRRQGSESKEMPTIDRFGSYRIYFYSNEGEEAPHVHVQRERMVAKFWLGPIVQARSSLFAAHELRKIERIVKRNQTNYMEAWNDFFG